MKASATILNLDDNAAARYLKSRALRQAGFEVIEAGTGMQALQIARERPPDIALLDVKLPDISGLEVCRRLKADPLTSDIPVVQTSATHVTDRDEAAGIEHGADIYLVEPVEPIVLVTVVRTLLRLRSTESGLLASEERFKAIVNQATAGIVQIDLKGRFLHANQRYLEIVGRSAEDLYKLRLFDITHFEDMESNRILFDRLVQDGVPFDVDKRYVRPDGAVVWVSNSVSLVRDKQGIAQHAIAVVIDITERKRAEERDHFLATVSEALAELTDQAVTLQKVTAAVVPDFADWCAVDIVDANGNIKRVASSNVDPEKKDLAQPLTVAHEQAATPADRNQQVFRLRRPELIANVIASAAKVEPGGDSPLLALRDFGLRSYIAVPLYSREQPIGMLAMGTLSSGRSYQHSDLIVASELGRRVSTAIENANLYFAIQLEALHKDEFLATLAHELRNPLAPLRNSLQIMRIVAPKEKAVEHALGVMERQVSQLRRLVDDLLDVSRINTGKFELRRERVLLSTIIDNAMEGIRSAIEDQHQLTVALPAEDIYLLVDPARISQIITNLLDNAVKYTPPGGRIWLSAEKRGAGVTITVKDTGIGLAPEMVDKIFDMFVQADSSVERPYGGLGIGLTLVRRLIEMHGGKISAASPGRDKGSSFVVELPALNDGQAAIAETGHKTEADGAAAAKKRNIVVVDDNLDAAHTFGSLLQLMGHEVRIANDGPQALRLLSDAQPEVIFLDIGLPGMNGYEVVRHIREDARNKDLLVIALSGYGTSQDRKRSQEAGFDMHIIKPMDIEELKGILARP